MQLLDFVCEKSLLLVAYLHFFVDAKTACVSTANERQASKVFALALSAGMSSGEGPGELGQKKSPSRNGWVTFGLEGPLLSDLWMTLDVAGLHERITVGETVESNVVVFDLRIKRGDF